MKKTIILLLAATALAGCKTEIDNAEVVVRNGLIYKYGEKDPFSGVVLNTPAGQRGINGLCNVHIVKGRLDGKKECFQADQKIYEAEFSTGNKNGIEIIFDATTGKETSIKNWKNDRLNGLTEEFIDGTMISQKEYKDGKLDGKEFRWSDDGQTILTELTWKNNNRQTGFETTPQGKNNYLDGKLHGRQISYSKTNNGNQYIYIDSNYSHGKFDGIFKEYSNKGGTDTIQQKLEILYKNSDPVSGWFRAYKSDGSLIQEIKLVRAPNDDGKGVYDDYPGTLVPDGLIKKYDKYFDSFNGEEFWVDGVKVKQYFQHNESDEPDFQIKDTNNQFTGYSSVSRDQYLAYKTEQTFSPDNNQVKASNTQTPSTENCVTSWISAFRAEMGEDAMIVGEQLDEWKGWCSEGKQP